MGALYTVSDHNKDFKRSKVIDIDTPTGGKSFTLDNDTIDGLVNTINRRRPFPLLGPGDLIRTYLRNTICCCFSDRCCTNEDAQHKAKLFEAGKKRLERELDIVEVLSTLRQHKIFMRAVIS